MIINVTLNRQRPNHVPNLVSAMDKAKNGDTIIIRNDKIAIGDGFVDANGVAHPNQRDLILSVHKSLTIEGSDPDNPSIIKVFSYQTAFFLMNGDFTLKNVVIQLSAQSNAITVSPHYRGNIVLKNVIIRHVGKMAEDQYWPSISVNEDGKPVDARMSMTGCYIDDVQISTYKSVKASRCELGRLDAIKSTINANGIDISGSGLTHLVIENIHMKPAYLYDIRTKGMLQLLGNASVYGLFIADGVQRTDHPLGYMGFGANPTQTLKSYGVPDPMPVIIAKSFPGADNQIEISKVKFDPNFRNLYGGNIVVHPYWFEFLNASVQLFDFEMPNTPSKTDNRIYRGDLMFTNVNDHTQWLEKDAEVSGVRSDSSLLKTLASGQTSLGSNTALAKMNQMIGIGKIKKSVHKMVDDCIRDEKKHHGAASLTDLHAVFVGPKGTGKTTVARLFSRALYEEHIIEAERCVSVDCADLVKNNRKMSDILSGALDSTLLIKNIGYLCKKTPLTEKSILALRNVMHKYPGRLILVLIGTVNEVSDFLDHNGKCLRPYFKNVVLFHSYSPYNMAYIMQFQLNACHLQWQLSTAKTLDRYLLALLHKYGSYNGMATKQFVDGINYAREIRLEQEAADNGVSLKSYVSRKESHAHMIKISDVKDGFKKAVKIIPSTL